ncbi:MAG TPA: carboxypeptidase-like regulatory domain-containing protein [Pirellulales bacterium]|nr:carboxypeptidase-like regulatory domain-containing protein [Pirellulales bacterium]
MGSDRFARSFCLAAWIALAGLGLGGSQGCSRAKRGDPNGRPVTGAVTYQGSPVEGANVTFVSASTPAFGRTDAEGKFKLATAAGENVPLGSYQVAIVKKEAPLVEPESSSTEELGDGGLPADYQFVPPDPNAPPPAEPKDLLPAKYADAAKSGLSATVTADGKNEFDFPLTD